MVPYFSSLELRQLWHLSLEHVLKLWEGVVRDWQLFAQRGRCLSSGSGRYEGRVVAMGRGEGGVPGDAGAGDGSRIE